MTDRAATITAFLAASDWAGWQRHALAGDASSRRYERLKNGPSQVILMDAPPENGETTAAFARITRLLQDAGLSPPDVLAHDQTTGIMVLSDLGANDFAAWLAACPKDSLGLYRAATDVLVQLTKAAAPADLIHMTPDIGAQMVEITGEFYAQKPIPDLTQEVHKSLSALAPHPNTLALRDYHAENLLWLPERNGVARVGLLDFQDAMVGHPAYDLVSLLQDARRDVPPALEQAMLSYYIERAQVEPESFRASYALLGLQRNLRILGVFARLCLKSGKPGYIDMIPRVWEFIERNLQHPALQHLGPLITGPLPAPNPEILSKLRTQCATPQPA